MGFQGQTETSVAEQRPALWMLFTCASNQELLTAIIGIFLTFRVLEHCPMLPDVISVRERITSGHETNTCIPSRIHVTAFTRLASQPHA